MEEEEEKVTKQWSQLSASYSNLTIISGVPGAGHQLADGGGGGERDQAVKPAVSIILWFSHYFRSSWSRASVGWWKRRRRKWPSTESSCQSHTLIHSSHYFRSSWSRASVGWWRRRRRRKKGDASLERDNPFLKLAHDRLEATNRRKAQLVLVIL